MSSAGLVIRELAPALLDDYLAFFDRDAFADFPWWSGCYCTFYRDPAHDGNSSPETIPIRRSKAIEVVGSGEQQGLLAYVDGKVIGWCNADVRARYRALRRFQEVIRGNSEQIGAILCFVVAAPHRGKGVAGALLDAACARFRRWGLALAEAYPNTAPPSGPYAAETPWSAHNYHGSVGMYMKAGFTVHRQLERFAVVRKSL